MAQIPPGPAPIPMDDRLFSLALELKEAGLAWQPQVGCFVWDHRGVIAHPSPFPKQVYFILSMKRFVAIFGDAEQMKRDLVWLPTWFQARQILDRLPAGGRDMPPEHHSGFPAAAAEEEMLRLYRRLLRRLKAAGPRGAPNRETPNPRRSDREARWTRSVIASDLGPLHRLPPAVQSRVEAVYGEVAKAYLGWRRIQEGQAEDWLPRETALDADLLDALGHFYSDYQRPIQRLVRTRKAVQLLNAIEGHEPKDEYDRLMATIMETDEDHPSPKAILSQLTAPDNPDPAA